MQPSSRIPEIVPIDPVWSDLIDPRWVRGLDDSLFLARCLSGAVEEEELRSFLVQQHYYSRHFTRYLCALLSNMANDRDRLALAGNLFEELGLGEMGSVPHSVLYQDMMRDLGSDPSDEAPNAATLDLVATMSFHCRSHDAMDGLGALCLGAEAIVPHVYSQVVAGFRSRGIGANRLGFLTLHIENDDDHALTMKAIIGRETARSPGNAVRLRHAAETVIEKRRRFFDEISLRQATRSLEPRRAVAREATHV